MAEILLRIAPWRENGQDVPGFLRCGETIAVCEDGHPWSVAEQSHPDWKIVAIPGVPASSLERLLDVYTDEEKARILAGEWDGVLADGRLRAWRFNTFALAALLANAEATAAFLAAPSWEAAFALELVVRWDSP